MLIPEPKNSLFGVGHTMHVHGIELEDTWSGFIVKVSENGKFGYIPLADLELISKDDRNYWPLREYVVWFNNQ